MTDRVLVLVPAFNEADCIHDVVAEIRAADLTDILVVDDGSSDGTGALARSAGAMVLTLPFNLGVGGALRAGLRFALRHGYDAVVQVDGDGQHDPSEAPRLLERLASADLVIGARFAGRGQYASAGPRRWAMLLLAAVLSRVAGTRLTDVTSGYRAFGPRAIGLLSETLPAEYLGDTVDAIVVSARAGLVVAQEPVAMRLRLGGRPSAGTVKSSLYLFRAVLALLLSTIRRDGTGAGRGPGGHR